MISEHVNNQSLLKSLKQYSHYFQHHTGLHVEGRLTRLVGMTLEAVGCTAPIGSRCLVTNYYGELLEAEIVGFTEDKVYLMCIDKTHGLAPGAHIIPTGSVAEIPVGDCLLGRVIDGSGRALDGLGPIESEKSYPLSGKVLNPLARTPVVDPLDVGIKAINSLLTVGRGQRIGLFAGSGVGKSVLLGMMTRFTTAQVIVVGLIGERGREVKEFIEQTLGEEGLKRSVIIAVPADQTPLMRLHGAMAATSVAEYFRDQGKQVLLLMDSLTRYAQAQREIGLAIGEPPATKGYPPSVFSKLSQLVERAGNAEYGKGSITAFYTVLAEGDDTNDPISDSARAILDGHLVLSRKLAESNHYPAIDIDASISRVLVNVTSHEHQQFIHKFKQCYAKYNENKDLISIGAYVKGSDPEIDNAIEKMPYFKHFLQQSTNDKVTFSESLELLKELF